MSFLKKFIKDSAIYSIPEFLNKGLAIFLIPLYTRILSPSDYGTLDLLIAFGVLMNVTVSLEITQGAIRHYMDASSALEKKNYASTALWFTLGCYTLFLSMALTLAPELSKLILGIDGLANTFRLAVVYIYCNGLFLFFQNQLRCELRSETYTLSSVSVSLLIPLFAVTTAYGLDMKVDGLLLGMACGTGIGALLSLWQLKNSFALAASSEKLREMLSYSLPLIPSAIAVFIGYYIDRWMIQQFMSLEDVGLYGLAYRIASIVGLLVVGFRVSLSPLIFAHHQDAATPPHIALVFRLFVSFSLLLVLALSLFSSEILWLMTTPDYYAAASITYLLVPAMILSNLYIFAPGIDIAKKTYIVLGINVAMALSSAAFSYLLIPLLGIEGAALSALLKSLVMFGGYMIFSQKYYPIPHNWLKILSAAVLFAALTLLGQQLTMEAWQSLHFKIGLIVVALIVVIGTGMIKLEEVKYVIGQLTILIRKPAKSDNTGTHL